MKRPDIKSYLKKRLTETGPNYRLTNLGLKNYSADQDNYIDHVESQRKELIEENKGVKIQAQALQDAVNELMEDLKNTLVDFMHFQSQHHIEQFDDFNETVDKYLESIKTNKK